MIGLGGEINKYAKEIREANTTLVTLLENILAELQELNGKESA